MIKEAIKKIVQKQDLTEQEASEVMEEIMSGKTTDAQIGAFITVLKMKGETIDEVTGFVRVMRKKATSPGVKEGVTIVDTCGTGGSGRDAFNVSTASAFVVAGSGLKVAKHGNRAISSLCGSADVIQELGVNINIPAERVGECIDKVGIGFLFAPAFHGAMKYAIGPRREIGIRTVFNIIGPLTNPAGASAQVLGVYDAGLTEIMANVLKNLGVRRAFVVHGEDGMDEITVSGKTKVSELKDGRVSTYEVSPETFGFKKRKIDQIKGGLPRVNAGIIMSVLKGEKGAGREITVMNAACAIVAGGKAGDFAEGVKIAETSIDSGSALKKLELMKDFTNT